MNIVKSWNNIIIDDIIVIWEDFVDDKIFLSSKIWPSMNHQKTNYKHIDYPWEYEFDNIYIVWNIDEENMNYKIKLDSGSIWFIQSNKFIKESYIEDLDTVLVINEDILNRISKIDYEGKIINIENI